jgi:hypothetical protein
MPSNAQIASWPTVQIASWPTVQIVPQMQCWPTSMSNPALCAIAVTQIPTTQACWMVQNQLMFTPFVSGNLYYHSIPDTLTTGWQPTVPILTPLHPPTIAYCQATPLHLAPATSMPRRPVVARPAILQGRRALRKSLDLFRKLRPEAELKTFLAGQSLTIRGHRFDYRVKKRDDLLRHTMNPHSAHIPYDLHLVDRHTGKQLAKGCVIIPGTPVIDQLLALILHVQDPDEELVVIHITNWSPSLSGAVLEAANSTRRLSLAA